MFKLAYSFACLAEAVILFPASLFTFKKLYQGSKSDFAYLLTAFTIANAFCRLSVFIESIFTKEEVPLPNGYAYITNYYLNYLLSLQPWIFGMKYFWSGVLCSEVTYVSPDCIKYFGWTGGLFYVIFMIISWCLLLVTFPGWTDTKEMEWYDDTFNPIIELSLITWAVFNFLSTIVTILAIYKIVHTVQKLKKYNAGV
jgi:hypothetical protein